MRKLFIVGVSVALLAGGITSCKKTTKGKMSNEWTVSSMTTESTSIYQNGDKSQGTTKIDGSTGTMKIVDTPTVGLVTTTEETAVVNEMTYTIEKDGTWKSYTDITWTSPSTGGSSSEARKTTTSGTWSFLSKNKTGEFKTNERVIFNTLSEKEEGVSSTTTGSTTTTSNFSSEYTFGAGENSLIYVVVESKSKELQLKADFEETSSSTAGGTTNTSSDKITHTMTLVQK